MLQFPIFHYKHNEYEKVVGSIAIKCINCNKDVGLHIKIQQLNK